MSENLDAIKRRVAKLLAIAKDGRGNIEEAAAAAAMAERIMRKYQLENIEEIEAHLKRGEDLATATSKATAKTNGTKIKKVPPWANMLGTAVSRFCGCGSRIIYIDDEVGFKFYGYKDDVELCKW